MRDINSYLGTEVFDVRKNMKNLMNLLVSYIFAMILIIIMITSELMIFTVIAFIAFFGLAVLWFVFIINYLKQISNQIALIESDQLLDNPISKKTTVILFFLYWAAIPYIQSHVNRIIDKSTGSVDEIKRSKIVLTVKVIVGVFIAIAIYMMVLFVGITQLFKINGSYKTAIYYIENNSAIISEVGGITGYGMFPTGSLQINNGYGRGKYHIKVKGTAKDITVFILLEKEPKGEWAVKEINY